MHLITGEYPPSRGGVADYTAVVASALAAAGNAVHVWCPGDESSPREEAGVVVHRSLGKMDDASLARASRALATYAAPRRLVVQWVPHAFGRRALNVGFCRWILGRARAGDRVEIVVHEPFLPFGIRPARSAAAAVQRVMTALLLRAASHVWVVTPAWEPMWRPYGLGRSVPFTWLPQPASIPMTATPQDAARVRTTVRPAGGGQVVGSFSCGSPFAQEVLATVVPHLLERHQSTSVLLIGAANDGAWHRIVARHAALAERIHATGSLEGPAVSAHLSACDLMVQPYPDGICTRHSSAMTVLAHGLPIVTNEGRFTEPVWRTSGAACVTASSAAAITCEIDRLLPDDGARHALAARALATYRSEFDVDVTVDALLGAAACV